jgi:hypothetical protein
MAKHWFDWVRFSLAAQFMSGQKIASNLTVISFSRVFKMGSFGKNGFIVKARPSLSPAAAPPRPAASVATVPIGSWHDITDAPASSHNA